LTGGNVVRREICNVYSKGTFVDPSATYEPKFILAVKINEATFQVGISLFDITTLKFIIGYFVDDASFN